jgi:hypothetical protein
MKKSFWYKTVVIRTPFFPAIILLFIILKFNFNSKAQTDWAPIGSKWSNEMDNWWNNRFYFWTFTSVKDTLVLNKLCKKIVLNNSTSYYVLMYNENEKVYYSYKDTFLLLYDFSLKTGDTLVISKLYPNEKFQDSLKTKYIIDKVDSINISGKILKRQKVHYLEDSVNGLDDNNYLDGNIIEKIGCESYLFGYPHMGEDGWPDHLKCYQDHEISYKRYSKMNCDGLDGISEIDKLNELQLYPNPAFNKININCILRQALKMQLFNTVGQCVLEREVNNLTNSIDISSLTKGIYILKLTSINGTLEKKIIKE